MRYALLDFLACPYCHAALVCHAHREESAADAAEVHEGLLVCARCGRWYPIAGQIPEVLPDHLRDRDRDLELFRAFGSRLPAATRGACERFVPGGEAADDAGAHHKAAEIGIRSKIDDPGFFGPGHTSPFNPGNTEFTLYLVHLFGVIAPLLEAGQGDVVVDSGSGYSWTTEWLYRSGINAIGVDICRAYLEIGVTRMGASRPHLVVGDVEQLPLGDGCARAVLAYESFHHIPNRPRALRGYDRVLGDGGRLVLAEPGAAHASATGSVEVMEKYGILEKGMELADVAAYAAGTRFSEPEQIFNVRASHRDLPRRLVEIARTGSPIDGNIFLLRKGIEAGRPTPAPANRATDRAMDATHFDAHYYAHCCGQPYCRNEQWLTFFGAIADRIVREVLAAAPGVAGEQSRARVLDAGCALGLLVESLRTRGVDAEGIDVSDYAIQQAHESVRQHCRVGSIAGELPRRYDLIVCIEVTEHMPADQAEAAIANLCRHTDDILFSSSPTDYGEATHVNVRPPEYWAELFARHGFLRDVDFDASFITAWAARFRRRAEAAPRIVQDYERALARTAIERNDLRAQVLRFDRDIIVAAAEAPRLREQLTAVNRQLLDTQHQLNQARDRIVHMERSAFWRLREVWVGIRGLFTRGGPADR